MPNLTTLPDSLRPVIERFLADVTGYMSSLELGTLTPDAWQVLMGEALARYHIAALMVGMDSTELTAEIAKLLDNTVAVQLDFLDNFTRVIKAAGGDFNPAWLARAQMYAMSPRSSWVEGDMIKQTGRLWPVNATPGQGTQCLVNCRCFLRYEVLDAEKGDANIYWELGSDDEHNCQTCQIRRQEWYPMRVRNGALLP